MSVYCTFQLSETCGNVLFWDKYFMNSSTYLDIPPIILSFIYSIVKTSQIGIEVFYHDMDFAKRFYEFNITFSDTLNLQELESYYLWKHSAFFDFDAVIRTEPKMLNSERFLKLIHKDPFTKSFEGNKSSQRKRNRHFESYSVKLH